MTQDDEAIELSKRANALKEAIRQSTAKTWVKEHYTPPIEASSELDALVKRAVEQDDTKE
jgi:hypothetical protein